MIIFCDIDHTISDAAWRDHLMGKWDEYYPAGDNDKPIVPILRMIQLFGSEALIIGSTARPEKWRQLTMKWLLRYDVPFHDLLMRANGDTRTSSEVKTGFLKTNPYVPDLVIDDRQDVCAAFCKLGISTLLSTYCGIRK